MFRVTVLTLALLSAGCVSLDPTYQRPDAPVPATLHWHPWRSQRRGEPVAAGDE